MPGVSGVGDVELSADEEGDRRRAAADDLVRLFVAQDQPEGEIMNDVLFIAKAESGKGRANCVNKSVALMRSMHALASAYYKSLSCPLPRSSIPGRRTPARPDSWPPGTQE